ncbi:DUF6290 family protein [Actinomadura scrupuli]|uniref:DUF6290 family protein n=1 Tax=Actinomadura scrupuli TaxID=559629 RepID=UPI003D9866AE
MAREPKGAVVSLRLSEDEQERLREIAETRGTSVSEVIRGVVRREFSEPLPIVETETSSSAADSSGQLGTGVFWDAPKGSVVTGNTITISY